MKAMILAAGEGRRMHPLTLSTPKPLLKIGEYSLLEHQLRRLQKAGIQEVLINVAYLSEQIVEHVGDGRRYGLNISFSKEPKPLETGGAINYALPFFANKNNVNGNSELNEERLLREPFLLINADVWCDFDFKILINRSLADDEDGCLVLVKNPEHNKRGDFSFSADLSSELDSSLDLKHSLLTKPHSRFHNKSQLFYTFSGISLQRASSIKNYTECREIFPLKEYFDDAIVRNTLAGITHEGLWVDVGTPERLETIRALQENDA